jgi:flagellar basal body-associated protein FliL
MMPMTNKRTSPRGGQLFSNNFENKIADAGKTVYDGTAIIGRISAVFTIVIGVIIAFTLIGFGIASLLHSSKYKGRAQGTVTGVSCDASGQCTTAAQFVASNGKSYSVTQTSNAALLAVGQAVNVYYNESDPSAAGLNEPNGALGWILIVIGIFVLIVSVMIFVFAWTSKVGAAATGVGAIRRVLF